jgi:AcrR family transcriptional regulator
MVLFNLKKSAGFASMRSKRPAREDHRVRVARVKRERTRAQLLDAVLMTYPGQSGRDGPAVIDDVIQVANVARGTFYKYFPSLEEAVSELGAKLAHEMVAAIASLYDSLEDPVQRSATGFQLYLSRALIEPKWGEFVAHLNHLRPDNRLVMQITADLTSGVKAGTYDLRSVDVGVRLIIGAMIEGIKGIIEGSGSRIYIELLTGMVLRGLGVPPKSADHAALSASRRLHTEGPAKLPWWRPFD